MINRAARAASILVLYVLIGYWLEPATASDSLAAVQATKGSAPLGTERIFKIDISSNVKPGTVDGVHSANSALPIWRARWDFGTFEVNPLCLASGQLYQSNDIVWVNAVKRSPRWEFVLPVSAGEYCGAMASGYGRFAAAYINNIEFNTEWSAVLDGHFFPVAAYVGHNSNVANAEFGALRHNELTLSSIKQAVGGEPKKNCRNYKRQSEDSDEKTLMRIHETNGTWNQTKRPASEIWSMYGLLAYLLLPIISMRWGWVLKPWGVSVGAIGLLALARLI